jgi:subtilase family serine protease
LINAKAQGVTVLAASGDGGATDNTSGNGFYLRPVNSWPSSDPLVTSVGGTQLHLTSTGARTQPDNVWNDTGLFGSPEASGGGVSEIFSRPAFQAKVVTGSSRATPDVSMSAAVNGGVLVYLSAEAAGTGSTAGYAIVGGTSEATPLFSGIVALAAQKAGHNLGWINPTLYKMAFEADSGIVDVTAGSNTVTFEQGGASHTVKGHPAVLGYDMSSGLGTVDAAAFVPALAAAAPNPGA